MRRSFVRNAVCWCAGTGLVGFAACVSPPATTYRDSYDKTAIGGLEQTRHTNSLELGIQEQLGAGSEYRIGERFFRTDQSLDDGISSSDELRTMHQPSVDLSVAFGALTWLQGFETRITNTKSSDSPDNQLRRTNILEKLEWTPVDLPRVTSWVDHRAVKDDLFTDREDTEFTLEVDETRGPFDYSYFLETQDIQESVAGAGSSRVEHALRGSYEDDHLDGKLTSRADVTFEHRTTSTRVPAAGVSETRILLETGYGAVDATPEIAVLPELPALTDRDFGAPTGINIGGFASGGEVNWNIGARLPVSGSGGVVYLYTAEEVDAFLVSQFTFSVWKSDDNNFWTLVTGSAAFFYEETLDRFRIVFPEVEARYLKVVNAASPPTAPAVLVTEIEVWEQGAAGGSGTRSIDDVSIRTRLNGGLSYRPTDELTLNYDLFLQTIDRETAGQVSENERRVDNAVSLYWTPTPTVDVNLRTELQDTRRTVVPSGSLTLWSGLIDWQPIETLDFALSHIGTNREEGGSGAFETSGTQVRTSAQILDTLSSDLTFERSMQQDHLNLRQIKRFTLTASLIANLTRSLDVTLAHRDEDARVTGSGAGEIPDPSEQQTEVLVLYQPSEQLTAEVRLEWRRSFAEEGLDRRFRIDWIPFRDGSIDLQLDVDHSETASIEATAFDRYLMISRWNMNSKAYFELNLSAQIPDEGPHAKTLTFSFNLVM